MADYIYLLETRLSPSQQAALNAVREVSRAHGMTVFLVGGAVRDLAGGASIRDLDVTVQGNATKLKKDLEKAGGKVVGINDTMQALFLTFAGGVRIEVASTLSVSFPKPGKPVAKPATILDDLRGRDFTANSMAVSLNEGSFGLLMDPLNGMADIENRELRLVSNYGFIEDPARMIRAARLSARLGWQLEERTQQRYETGKAEGYISAMSAWQRSYELEEIFHEEDPLRVQRRLESEGWSKVLFPGWTAAKANEAELERLRDLVGQFGTMGIFPDSSAVYFGPLTAKLQGKDTAHLKKAFAREGFAAEIDSLEARTKAFGAQFTSKAAAVPSDAWKMIYAADPQAVLSLAFSNKTAAVQEKFKHFFNDWPQARQHIPYQLMQEMRITPELPGYDQLLETLFFAMMDGKLQTPEEAKAFLEPYSPPAPPPPPSVRRRAVKRESKAAKPKTPKVPKETVAVSAAASAEGGEAKAAAAKKTPAKAAASVAASAKKPAVPVKSAKKPEPAKKAPAKAAAAKTAAKPAVRPAKPAKAVKKATPAKSAKKSSRPAPAKKAAAKKVVAKPVKKAVAKKTAAKKPVSKAKPAKKAPAKKTVAKKSAKAAKKRR